MNVQKQARALATRQRRREENRRASLQTLISAEVNRVSFDLDPKEYFH